MDKFYKTVRGCKVLHFLAVAVCCYMIYHTGLLPGMLAGLLSESSRRLLLSLLREDFTSNDPPMNSHSIGTARGVRSHLIFSCLFCFPLSSFILPKHFRFVSHLTLACRAALRVTFSARKI